MFSIFFFVHQQYFFTFNARRVDHEAPSVGRRRVDFYSDQQRDLPARVHTYSVRMKNTPPDARFSPFAERDKRSAR